MFSSVFILAQAAGTPRQGVGVPGAYFSLAVIAFK